MVIVMTHKDEYFYKRLLTVIYGTSALIILITYILAVGISLSFFFSPEGSQFTTKIFQSIRLNVFYFGALRLPISVEAWQLFVGLNLIFLCSFLVAFFSKEPCHSAMKRLFVKGDENAILSNFLVLMPALTSATLLVTTALNVIMERVGIEVGQPSFSDPFSEIISLSYAVISEEVGFRLMPILVPLAAYLFLKTHNVLMRAPKKNRLYLILVALFKPESYIKKLKVLKGKAWKRLQFFLIILSSIMFAYAHLLFGSWSLGKVPSTFIAGLIIGYCSVRYGFDSAVLIHWFFNYYWSALAFPMKLGVQFPLLNELSYILTVYLGLFTLLYVAFRILGLGEGQNV